MKTPALLLTLLLAAGAAHAAEPVRPAAYDAQLAKDVGANDMGMRRYVMALLRSGPNRATDPAERTRLQAAHMANIGRMADEGKLVVAGPFMDGGELRGIYVFAVETVDEAKKLTETDPLIQSGGLVMELHPWFASAALMKTPALHETLKKPK